MLPSRIESVDINPCLETPQVRLSWTFQDDDFWYIPWTYQKIVRNYDRFPLTEADGTTLLGEVYSTSPTTTYADTSPTASTYAYYSLFIAQTLFGHSGFNIFNNVKRQFVSFYGLGVDRNFLAWKGWMAGVTHNGDKVIKEVMLNDVNDNRPFTREIDYSGILDANEELLGIGDAGLYGTNCVKALAVFTNQRILILNVASMVDSGANGATGNDGLGRPRRLTSAGNNFTETVHLGDTLTIRDFGAMGDNGEYTINDIISDTQIDVDSNFIGGGGLAVLDFYISRDEDVMMDAHILWEYDLIDVLSDGFTLGDSYARFDLATGEFYFYLLDTVNQEVGFYDTAGGPATLVDYSGLTQAYNIHSLAFDANGDGGGTSWICLAYANHVMRFDPAATPLTDADCLERWVTPYDISPKSLIVVTDLGVEYVWFMEEETGIMYLLAGGLGVYDQQIYWQDWYDADRNTVVLFHLEETAGAVVTNSAGAAGVRIAATMGAQGKHPFYYSRCYQTTGVSNYVLCAASAAGFDGNNGSVEHYFRTDDTTEYTGARRYLFRINHTVTGHYIDCSVLNSTIEARYFDGVATTTAVAAFPSIDTDWHHIAVVWDASGAPKWIQVIVDGTILNTANGILAAIPAFNNGYVVGVPGGTGNSALGYYDEVRISAGVSRLVNSYGDSLVQKVADLHEWTGRDYTTTPFEFREQLFSEFVPEATRERDVNKVYLVPNTVVAGSEVVNRGGSTTAGHLQALLKMHGLFLDRIVDARDRVVIDQDIDTVSRRYIDSLSKQIGYPSVSEMVDPYTHEELTMVRLRQITRGMVEVYRRKGSISGMHLYAKLYHMALDLEMLYYRRFWDSVVDPIRDDVYLDTITLDSSDGGFPIGELRVRSYYRDLQVATGNIGATGAAGTDTFSDGGAGWLSMLNYVRPGDMLAIIDTTLATQAANGQYRITSVDSGTVLRVDHTWTVAEGALAGLSYEIWKYLPAVDPMAEFIIAQLSNLLPYNVKLVYVDPT